MKENISIIPADIQNITLKWYNTTVKQKLYAMAYYTISDFLVDKNL